MFERFTDRARRVVVLAQEYARAERSHVIATKHVLLALSEEGEGVAAKALEGVGMGFFRIAAAIEMECASLNEGSSPGHLPFGPETKTMLELSLREALQLGHNYIGTEHILLALVRVGDVDHIFTACGSTGADVRQQVIQVLSGYSGPTVVHEDTTTDTRVPGVADLLLSDSYINLVEDFDEILKCIDSWACESVLKRIREARFAAQEEAGRCLYDERER